MRLQHQEVFVCIFLLTAFAALYLVSSKFQEAGLDSNSSSWIYRLTANILGYGIIFIPGYLIIKYLKRTNYVESVQKGCLWPILKQCVYGQELDIPVSSVEKGGVGSDRDEPLTSLSFGKSALLLIYCFGGLQISYLTWGILQEKIMTQSYSGKHFTDSQFLVFVNRIFGLIIASLYLVFYENRGSKTHKAPLYKYSYCAFSNIMSSWFQYEALKFVSFPTQVLAKASKIIPVMLMGKVISNKSYEFYEYLTALLISIGMILFLAGSSDKIQVENESGSTSLTAAGLSGFVILVSYMVFDSFTSNWQSELFRTYRMSSCRMMAGVNLFSLILTGISLIQQGSLSKSVQFLTEHTDFAKDCLILSICSAVGQLFIYYTIGKFGAVVFVIIMTIRQALAVLLSCLFYHHPISVLGIIGVIVVFLSIFLRIYCSFRLKQVRKKSTSSLSLASSSSVVKI